MESRELVKIIVKALDDKKGMDMKVIDISKVSIMTDYFIIVSGGSDRQVAALSDSVEEALSLVSVSPRNVEGYRSAKWILMDINDVVVHIFDHESRAFYDIERVWRDGELIPLEELLP